MPAADNQAARSVAQTTREEIILVVVTLHVRFRPNLLNVEYLLLGRAYGGPRRRRWRSNLISLR
jgi:hypothetical protein